MLNKRTEYHKDKCSEVKMITNQKGHVVNISDIFDNRLYRVLLQIALELSRK
jgi:hypothetical protein